MNIILKLFLCWLILDSTAYLGWALVHDMLFGAILNTLVTPVLLYGFGFEKGGITRGSVAADLSSTVYKYKFGVRAFAILQSIGTSGTGYKAPLFGALVGANAYCIRKYFGTLGISEFF